MKTPIWFIYGGSATPTGAETVLGLSNRQQTPYKSNEAASTVPSGMRPGAFVLCITVILAAFISTSTPGIHPLAADGAVGLEVRGAWNRNGAEQGTTPLASGARRPIVAITVDYPADGSIFPPEITPPTFLWRDGAETATVWRIDVSFADGSSAIHAISRGERMRIGQIDPSCVAETNELPKLTAQQAAAHTWIPDRVTWESIKRQSTTATATLTITGFGGEGKDQPVSRGWVKIRTSRDPVGAPIFYRDVPLMPTETEKGNIKPLAPYAVRLIRWRLRDISQPQSRVLLEDIPVCANCHSFSADGKTLGMDLDGLRNNKGLYTLTPLAPEVSIGRENVIQWSSAKGRLKGNIRVGFMSQVSPHGDYVVTTIDDLGATESQEQGPSAAHTGPNTSNYYVANFKNYRFLQVFYPTRGILAWYSRATEILQPLPGADDPKFVQMGGVWSPDGRYLVFARADAREPYPEGVPVAKFANDPNERQIQYDLYRIPFNDGKGGTPEPITGASRNGMSNSFPKVSPDGRWIVFVQSRNGLLMRPDSQLYMVPAAGGAARRMNCNTKLMNSWHSFSPNGRWLVFSSKSRSPYTQMYLTHIDQDGNDSPAVLVENTTAANRAVNIPEFVNAAPESLQKIAGPVIEYYRLVDSAEYFRKRGQYKESLATWMKVLEVSPEDALAHDSVGRLMFLTGRPQEAAAHIRKAEAIRLDGSIAELRKMLEFDPAQAPAYYRLGLLLDKRGKTEEAIHQWEKALEIRPAYAKAHNSLANALHAQGRDAEALAHWREGIRLKPDDAATLKEAAWVLATCPDASIRNAGEATALAERAVQLSGGNDPATLDALGAAYAESGRFTEAIRTAAKALALAKDKNQASQAEALSRRIALYETSTPFREGGQSPVSPF